MSRSGGLSDNTNQRAVSAPKRAMIASGDTVLRLDFDIFSTRPTCTAAPVSRRTAPWPLRSTCSG